MKETLKEQIERLEAESDHNISRETREEIWRKIRLGLKLSEQERLIHDYDIECMVKTGKWNGDEKI